MGLLDRLLRREAYSVSVDKAQSSFLYREGPRHIQVSGEAMADGYAIYMSSIQSWDNSPDEIVNNAERERITSNIRQYFVARGKSVYLS